MTDVFISYKREDREVPRILAEALEQQGLRVWYDFELLSGDRYRDVIRRVIDHSAAAIVIWSERAASSDFVIDEASHAKKQGKLFPVRIDGVDPPLGFGQMHIDDLSGWSGDSSNPGLQSLLRAIENRVDKLPALPLGSDEAERSKRELHAFKQAQVEGTTAAFRRFLTNFPDGSFAPVVREQLTLRSRLQRLPRILKVGAAVAVLGALLALVAVVTQFSISNWIGFPSEGPDPLTTAQLSSLVRRALELSAHGECSADVMDQQLLAACRAQATNNRATLEAQGPIVAIEPQGTQRYLGNDYTAFLVKFQNGSQRWYAKGADDGRLRWLFSTS